LNQLVDFQVSQFAKFFDRTVGSKLTKHADVTFLYNRVAFDAYCHALANEPSPDFPSASTAIKCEGIDWQVSHLAQVLSQISATLSNVVHLMLNTGTYTEKDQLEGADVE